MTVTAQDLAFADCLVTALCPLDDGERRKAKVRAVAEVLVAIHERAVACSVVRVEREFTVRRKTP